MRLFSLLQDLRGGIIMVNLHETVLKRQDIQIMPPFLPVPLNKVQTLDEITNAPSSSRKMNRACFFRPVLVGLSYGGQNFYFVVHYPSFNIFKIVNLIIVNYHSVKNYYKFFLSHKIYFILNLIISNTVIKIIIFIIIYSK